MLKIMSKKGHLVKTSDQEVFKIFLITIKCNLSRDGNNKYLEQPSQKTLKIDALKMQQVTLHTSIFIHTPQIRLKPQLLRCKYRKK